MKKATVLPLLSVLLVACGRTATPDMAAVQTQAARDFAATLTAEAATATPKTTSSPTRTRVTTPARTATPTPSDRQLRHELKTIGPQGLYTECSGDGVCYTAGHCEYRTKISHEWGRFLECGVGVENRTAGRIHTNPLHITLVDWDGLTYNVATETYGLSNFFDATDLQPNNHAVGRVAFKLSKDSVPRFLVYDDMWRTITLDFTKPERLPTPTPSQMPPTPTLSSPTPTKIPTIMLTPSPTWTPLATPTPMPIPLGSQSNPVPVRQPFTMLNGWQVTVLSFDPDAWPEVQAENRFNDPPLPGQHMVMIRLRVEYVGEEYEPYSMFPANFTLLGSSDRQYTTFGNLSRCGVIPDELSAKGYRGSTDEGNICFQIPNEESDLKLVCDVVSAQYHVLGNAYFRVQ